MSKTIDWSGYQWITQERWGQVHEEKSHWWYDASCVEIDAQHNLHLRTKFNPKTFNNGAVVSTIGCGLVSCTTKFGHGRFYLKAKLPKGPNLWPAFWMWSWDTWPPEIDVFEAYSNSRGSYLKPRLLNPLGFWNVQTNVHYTKDGRNKMAKGKTHWFGFQDPSEHFITYMVDWTPESVKFYYDDRLVRVIDDPLIMSQLNQTKMNVIINNGVTAEVDKINPPKSDFVIDSFEFYSNDDCSDWPEWHVTM